MPANESVQNPAPWDLNIYQGDTFDLRLTLTRNEDPIDLSSAVVTARVKDKLGVLYNFTVVEKRNDGFLHIRLPAVSTTLIGGGMWDLQIEVGGNVRTYLRGRVNVVKDVA